MRKKGEGRGREDGRRQGGEGRMGEEGEERIGEKGNGIMVISFHVSVCVAPGIGVEKQFGAS